MTEQSQRAAVIAEAKTWLRTPFVDCARVKGAGVDCAQFIAAVYENAGIIESVPLGTYSPQWHLHHSEPRYLDGLIANGMHEVVEAEAKPGDVVVFMQGRTFSHGALIVSWPRIIHAVKLMGGVCYSDVDRDKFLTRRERKFFSFWSS
jgi:cell wall-associated NlpC family hydrolase